MKEMLTRIWTSPHALEATQDLKEGVLLEQFYEDTHVAYALKTADGWDVREGKAPSVAMLRIFYKCDACEKLADSKDIDEFATTVQDVIEEREMIFIPLRPPDVLVKAGFSEFARRMGLPGK